MQAVRQIGSGILYGLVSVMLVVGGLSLALAESYTTSSPTPTASLPIVAQTLTSTQAGPTALPSSTPFPTATPLPPTNCPPPAGWILISVQPYDTLESLAARFRVTPYQLAQANCLPTNNLEPGYNIYVPLPSTCAPCFMQRAIWLGARLHYPAGRYAVSHRRVVRHIFFRTSTRQLSLHHGHYAGQSIVGTECSRYHANGNHP